MKVIQKLTGAVDGFSTPHRFEGCYRDPLKSRLIRLIGESTAVDTVAVIFSQPKTVP